MDGAAAVARNAGLEKAAGLAADRRRVAGRKSLAEAIVVFTARMEMARGRRWASSGRRRRLIQLSVLLMRADENSRTCPDKSSGIR
jgi:hypothetical protein